MNGNILNIQRFCTDDGPGIRTTVFLKGCPLSCVWCHNPESQSPRHEILFDPQKCVHCLQCVALCPTGAHKKGANGHEFDRTLCTSCGKCASTYCNALEHKGESMSADAVLTEVLKDRAFYENSGGGLTLSGGEPLSQVDFCLELLQKAKESGLHVCIETCGHASAEAITALSPFVDVFLFDYKETDPARHKAYTGVDNSRILENLALLDRLGKTVVLRCPIIPGYNDRPDHFKGIADVANTHTHVTEVVVEPYHSLGSAKYTRLGRAYTLANVPTPDKETVLGWVAAIGAHTHKAVRSAIEY